MRPRRASSARSARTEAGRSCCAEYAARSPPSREVPTMPITMLEQVVELLRDVIKWNHETTATDEALEQAALLVELAALEAKAAEVLATSALFCVEGCP